MVNKHAVPANQIAANYLNQLKAILLSYHVWIVIRYYLDTLLQSKKWKKNCDFFLQIRLDFNNFVITGPSTVTLTSGWEVGGSIATAAGKVVSTATQCQTDTFSLTGPSGSAPPAICGTNTGEHSKTLFSFFKLYQLIG